MLKNTSRRFNGFTGQLVVVMMICCMGHGVWAAEPTGYYSTCLNLKDKALAEALYQVTGPHTTISYSGLWTLYATSDVRDDGTIWDMYSTKRWTYANEQCGSYKVIGDCYNREHSFPKSWFNDATPMVSDAFHIYPTDGKVNSQRGNHPFGECANGTQVASKGDVRPLGRLGTSTFPGYSGTVFEPDDQYKGDFARSYFYMAVAYMNRISSWKSDMLAGNDFPAFKPWAIEMLLKWHRKDPVSKKETDRNEAVYRKQKNRNPFIDHPELAEYLWGDKKGERWQGQAEAEPVINSPANGSTVDLGAAGVGVTRKFSLPVKATALKQDLWLEVTDGFAVTPVTVSATKVCGDEGAVVEIAATPAREGDMTGTLTLTSGSLKTTVTLKVTAYAGVPLQAFSSVTDESFDVRWVYVGDALTGGKYKVDVLHGGRSIDGYPRTVDAAAERYSVDGLEASTAYDVTVSSASLKSRTQTVTTAAPIPELMYYFNDEAHLSAVSGMPSAPFEVGFEAENMTGDITFTVTEPFELSSDREEWKRSVSVPVDEGRFYIRLNSAEDGEFETTVLAVCGEFRSDDLVFTGKTGSAISFIEDFETAQTTKMDSYDPDKTYKGRVADWLLRNVGMWESDKAVSGKGSLRFGKRADSSIEMITDKSGGAGVVTVYMCAWSSTEKAKVELLWSADQGETWTSAGEADVNSPDYTQYTFTVNRPGNVRLKFAQKSGGRLNMDDIAVSDYRTSGLTDTELQSWDAFSRRGGELVIESYEDGGDIDVYGIDGSTHFHARAMAGRTYSVRLPGGHIYIVSCRGVARRVLVK